MVKEAKNWGKMQTGMVVWLDMEVRTYTKQWQCLFVSRLKRFPRSVLMRGKFLEISKFQVEGTRALCFGCCKNRCYPVPLLWSKYLHLRNFVVDGGSCGCNLGVNTTPTPTDMYCMKRVRCCCSCLTAPPVSWLGGRFRCIAPHHTPSRRILILRGEYL